MLRSEDEKKKSRYGNFMSAFWSLDSFFFKDAEKVGFQKIGKNEALDFSDFMKASKYEWRWRNTRKVHLNKKNIQNVACSTHSSVKIFKIPSYYRPIVITRIQTNIFIQKV